MKIKPCTSLFHPPFVQLAMIMGWLLWGLPATAGGKEKWEPLAAEDLAATECKSYPGSSAEILLEKRVLKNTGYAQLIEHFRRIKIYSPKGAKEEGVIGIEYEANDEAFNVVARLTKPNGISTEYGQKDFTKSSLVNSRYTKLNLLILAVPDLGVGDILEIKWTQEAWQSRWWYFQSPLPVRHFVFTLAGSKSDCQLVAFNLPKGEDQPANAKPTVLEINNIPPYIEEPHMPPPRDVRGWLLLLYVDSLVKADKKDAVWKERSGIWDAEFRNLTKPNAAIKAKTTELLKDATADDEKLRVLYDFCQQEVTNFDYSESAELQIAEEKLNKRSSRQFPAETLKLRTGYSHHINELFAALVRAAGYEVLLARSASRNETLFVRHKDGWLFLPDDIVVVKIGESLRYYTPGHYYVPAGMLDQSNESAPSLITDPKKIIFETNPVASAAMSPVLRQGRFVVDAEGSLEGEVEISMGGHAGISRKESWRLEQQATIDADYRAGITRRLPAAEVSDLQWENIKGNKLPLIVRYKLKIPAFADVAGSKVILPANVFAHGSPAVFASATRKYAICFDHAWSEHDDIEITLPEGYTLEAGSAPANIGDPAGIVGVRYQVSFKPKAHKLIYKRDFALGGNGAIAFQAGSYPALKRLFDSIQRSDEHVLALTLMPAVPAMPSAGSAPPAP